MILLLKNRPRKHKEDTNVIGAIIGDINGSVYEFHNYRKKDFKLFASRMSPTDDSVLTIAVMKTFNETMTLSNNDIHNKEWQSIFKETLIKNFVEYVRKYPSAGYGGMFYNWSKSRDGYKPYGSYGNGAAMRVSPVGWVANSEEEVKILSRLVTEVTHNHPEGIKGAEATAMAIYLARTGSSKEQIQERIKKDYYSQIDSFDYEDLVKNYFFNETCQESVPQALYCFLISKDFEDCIRTTISIGGDCDTTAAISCAVADAFYGIPDWMIKETEEYLPTEMVEVIHKFKDIFNK